MIKDIDQLRKEKEREEEKKILQAINDNCKRKQAERKQAERKQAEEKQRQQQIEDIKSVIKVTIFFIIMFAVVVVLWLWCDAEYKKSVANCMDRGYSEAYCDEIMKK